MTVAELLKALEVLPSDCEVRIEGYAEGVSDLEGCRGFEPMMVEGLINGEGHKHVAIWARQTSGPA